MKRTLLIAILIIGFSGMANGQCKIIPEAIFLFPEDLNRNFIHITGTWMSAEKQYDPRNPNTAVISCDRQNYECRVTPAYIVNGILDLWEWNYKVVLWNSETIVAVGVPWLNKESDEGRPVLMIKRSYKSVAEDNSTLLGILLQRNLPKNRRMVLKEGNPL